MKEPTKDQITQTIELYKQWHKTFGNCENKLQFEAWLDDKLKPVDPTFEKFKAWWKDPDCSTRSEDAYKQLREDVFADELNQTKGLDEIISWAYENQYGSVVSKAEKIKSKLEVKQ